MSGDALWLIALTVILIAGVLVGWLIGFAHGRDYQAQIDDILLDAVKRKLEDVERRVSHVRRVPR